MTKALLRKKFIVPVVALAAVGAVAGGAFAFFSTTGSGTGTAATGTSSAITVHGTTAGALFPRTSSTVSFTVDNPSSGNQLVNTIHLVNVTTDAGHSGCNMSDFTMPDVSSLQNVAAGNGTAITATGTITMADNGNQDACKGAPLTLNLTSN